MWRGELQSFALPWTIAWPRTFCRIELARMAMWDLGMGWQNLFVVVVLMGTGSCSACLAW